MAGPDHRPLASLVLALAALDRAPRLLSIQALPQRALVSRLRALRDGFSRRRRRRRAGLHRSGVLLRARIRVAACLHGEAGTSVLRAVVRDAEQQCCSDEHQQRKQAKRNPRPLHIHRSPLPWGAPSGLTLCVRRPYDGVATKATNIGQPRWISAGTREGRPQAALSSCHGASAYGVTVSV